MKQSRLLKMMKTLSQAEMRAYGHFLEGVPFQKTGGVYKLYKYLKKLHPQFEGKAIEKGTIQKKLFSTVSNPKKHLYDNASQLSISLEDFLIKKQLEKNQSSKDFLLLEVYKERKLDDLFFQKIDGIERNWRTEKKAGIDHLYEQYNLRRMCIIHPNFAVLNRDKDTTNLPELLALLDQFYFATKLYWTLSQLTSSNFVIKQRPEKKEYFVQEIIDYSSNSEFQHIPQISLLGDMAKTLLNQDFKNYESLRVNFFDNIELYDENERHDLFATLLHCFNQNRQANRLQELFELNRFAVEHQLMFENGYITVNYFINIVNIACLSGELDWIENFIAEYQQYLNENDRANTVLFCEANLLISRNDYGKALEKLSRITKFQNVFSELQAKCMQLQCYYEMDYDEPFDALIKSSTKFLKSKKTVGAGFKEGVSQFFHYAKEIKKLKAFKYLKFSKKMSPIEVKKEADKLLNEIMNTHNVFYKAWLIKKNEELRDE